MKDFPEHPVVGQKVLIDESMTVYVWDGELWRQDADLTHIIHDVIDYMLDQMGKVLTRR